MIPTEEHNTDGTPGGIPQWLQWGGAWGWRFCAMMGAFYIVFKVGYWLRLAVLPAVLGLVLATLLMPVSRLLQRWRLPRALAGALSVLLGLLICGGFIAIFAATVSEELSEFNSSIEQGYRQSLTWVAQTVGVSRDAVRGALQSHLNHLQSLAGGATRSVVSGVAGLVRTLTVLGVMVVFCWFFVWDGDKQFRAVVSGLPARQRVHAQELGQRIWDTVGAYTRGIVLIALADSILLGIGLLVLGMPLVLPLMLLMFVGAWIPVVGPVVTGAMAVLIGIAHGGASLGGLVAVVAVVVQQIEGNLLQPFIMGHAVQLHPAVILFAITAGGALGGIPGMFLAVPVAASLGAALAYSREISGSGT